MAHVESNTAVVRLGRACMPTIRYWMETEVHVYAFSIAANVLLSFYPFLIVMISICRYFLRWPAAEQAILLGLNDYFPGAVGDLAAQPDLSRETRPRRGAAGAGLTRSPSRGLRRSRSSPPVRALGPTRLHS